MRKNLLKVLEAFVEGKSATGDSKHTCSTDGQSVWSYQMLIAQKLPVKEGSIPEIEVITTEKSPSVTTSAQIRSTYSWLRDEQWRQAMGSKHSTKYHVIYVNDFSPLIKD